MRIVRIGGGGHGIVIKRDALAGCHIGDMRKDLFGLVGTTKALLGIGTPRDAGGLVWVELEGVPVAHHRQLGALCHGFGQPHTTNHTPRADDVAENVNGYSHITHGGIHFCRSITRSVV